MNQNQFIFLGDSLTESNTFSSKQWENILKEKISKAIKDNTIFIFGYDLGKHDLNEITSNDVCRKIQLKPEPDYRQKTLKSKVFGPKQSRWL